MSPQQRDCLYVDDVVECLLLAAVSPDAPGEVFNVGNEERLSVREITEAIVAAAGSGTIESSPWARRSRRDRLRPVVAPAATVGESSTARHTPPKERAVWRVVFGIMMASLELECWALVRDLPYPEVDEPVFVRPAVAS